MPELIAPIEAARTIGRTIAKHFIEGDWSSSAARERSAAILLCSAAMQIHGPPPYPRGDLSNCETLLIVEAGRTAMVGKLESILSARMN